MAHAHAASQQLLEDLHVSGLGTKGQTAAHSGSAAKEGDEEEEAGEEVTGPLSMGCDSILVYYKVYRVLVYDAGLKSRRFFPKEGRITLRGSSFVTRGVLVGKGTLSGGGGGRRLEVSISFLRVSCSFCCLRSLASLLFSLAAFRSSGVFFTRIVRGPVWLEKCWTSGFPQSWHIERWEASFLPPLSYSGKKMSAPAGNGWDLVAVETEEQTQQLRVLLKRGKILRQMALKPGGRRLSQKRKKPKTVITSTSPI